MNLMKKTFKNTFFLLIIFIQISSIKSYPEKCYSIPGCEKCPELDFCEKCLSGFILNKLKTKCISKNSQKYLIDQRNKEINKKMNEINNQLKQKNLPTPNKKPAAPFPNIPFKSIQQAKQSDLNRARINKLLIIIIIILAISIIISAAYDFIKRIMNNHNDDYDTQETTEESSKVVIR